MSIGVIYCWNIKSSSRIKYNRRSKANTITGYSSYDWCSIFRVWIIIIKNNYFLIGRVICCWNLIAISRFKYNSRTKANTGPRYLSYNCCSIFRVCRISISNNYFIIGRVICSWDIISITIRSKCNRRSKANTSTRYSSYNCCSIIIVVFPIRISNNYFIIGRVICCWYIINSIRFKYNRRSKANTSTRYSSYNCCSIIIISIIPISNNYFTISRVKCCWSILNRSRFKYSRSSKANTSSWYSTYNCCSIFRVSTIPISNNYFIIGRVKCCWNISNRSRCKCSRRTKSNWCTRYSTYNCHSITTAISISNNYFLIRWVIYWWDARSSIRIKYTRRSKSCSSSLCLSNNTHSSISIHNNFRTIC